MIEKIAWDFKKPAGLTAVSQKEQNSFLKKILIGDIPGVGRNTEALLKKYGYITAHDIAAKPKQAIGGLLGIRGEYMHDELNGIPRFTLNVSRSSQKSISVTRTFPQFSGNKKYIFLF